MGRRGVCALTGGFRIRLPSCSLISLNSASLDTQNILVGESCFQDSPFNAEQLGIQTSGGGGATVRGWPGRLSARPAGKEG